jgi:hypothetical protein
MTPDEFIAANGNYRPDEEGIYGKLGRALAAWKADRAQFAAPSVEKAATVPTVEGGERIAADVLAQIDRYATFGRGWDGYDGEPFDPDTIRLARLTVHALGVALAVSGEAVEIIPAPASDGTIDIEVCRGAKTDVAVSISPSAHTDEMTAWTAARRKG